MARVKRIPTSTYIRRTGFKRGGAAFEACVRIGSTDNTKHVESECANGPTPRAALAKALVSVGRDIGNRRGRYKGV